MFVALTTFSFFTGYSQALPIEDEVAIREVIGRQLSQWNSGSIDGFMLGYHNHDSLLFIGKNGIRRGWNNVKQMYQKSYSTAKEMGKLTFETVQIRSLGKSLDVEKALVVGKWFVVKEGLHKQEIKQNGNFTLIFRKIDGKWLIVSDHTN